MKKIIILVFFLTSITQANSDKLKIESLVEQVNDLRETLVKGVPNKVTKETFKAVCSPVGLRIKTIVKNNNLNFRQVSHKNRNPNNSPNSFENRIVNKFLIEPELQKYWVLDKGIQHYFRRIVINKSCLACHGPRSKAPHFIVKKYKNDKALEFKVGDLRGLYHVWKK